MIKHLVCSFLVIVGISDQSLLAQCQWCQNIYVWDFYTEGNSDNNSTDEITRLLTDDVEELLSQHSKCSVLRRRDYSKAWDHKINEKNIVPSKENLKIIGADVFVEGKITILMNGMYNLRLIFTNLNTTNLLSGTIEFSIYEIRESAKRKSKIYALLDKTIFKPCQLQSGTESQKDTIYNSKNSNITNSDPLRKFSALERITFSKTINVGFTYDAPMYYRDYQGKDTGFAFELAKIIADSFHSTLIPHEITYPEASTLLENGKIDLVISGFIPDIRHGKNLLWTKEYLKADFCLVVPEGSAIKSIKDLEGLTIGVYDEPFVKNWIKENIPSANIKSFSKPGWFEVLLRPEENVDAIINDYPYAVESLRHFPDLKIADFHVMEVSYGIGIYRDRRLLKILNNYLTQITKGRYYRQLLKKYFNHKDKNLKDNYDCKIKHRIERDETIFDIALKELGDSDRWMEIYELNKNIIQNPRNLPEGRIICIPNK